MTLPDCERIERAALAECFAVARPGLAAELGLSCESVAGALLGLVSALPASAIAVNRVMGLGFDEALRHEHVARIVGRYRDAGLARYFVQVHPGARLEGLGD